MSGLGGQGLTALGVVDEVPESSITVGVEEGDEVDLDHEEPEECLDEDVPILEPVAPLLGSDLVLGVKGEIGL